MQIASLVRCATAPSHWTKVTRRRNFVSVLELQIASDRGERSVQQLCVISSTSGQGLQHESALGQEYLAHQAENIFYRAAKFYSVIEVETLLKETGFENLVWAQTLSSTLSELHEIEPTTSGTAKGAFLEQVIGSNLYS